MTIWIEASKFWTLGSYLTVENRFWASDILAFTPCLYQDEKFQSRAPLPHNRLVFNSFKFQAISILSLVTPQNNGKNRVLGLHLFKSDIPLFYFAQDSTCKSPREDSSWVWNEAERFGARKNYCWAWQIGAVQTTSGETKGHHVDTHRKPKTKRRANSVSTDWSWAVQI